MRMRRSGTNTTSGIKSDHAIRSGMPENLYIKEILAKNAILWVFFSNVKFSPYSLHWRFSAHARKTGSCCPILMPNELFLTILVPNHHAKFGDDRLRIADARVVTDGQTDTHTDTHFASIISPACYTLHSIAMLEKLGLVYDCRQGNGG